MNEKGSEDGKPEPRPIRLFAPIYGGLGAGLSVFFIGSGISTFFLICAVGDTSLTDVLLKKRHSPTRVETRRKFHALRTPRRHTVLILRLLGTSTFSFK